jgi:hypothetical protein
VVFLCMKVFQNHKTYSYFVHTSLFPSSYPQVKRKINAECPGTMISLVQMSPTYQELFPTQKRHKQSENSGQDPQAIQNQETLNLLFLLHIYKISFPRFTVLSPYIPTPISPFLSIYRARKSR